MTAGYPSVQDFLYQYKTVLMFNMRIKRLITNNIVAKYQGAACYMTKKNTETIEQLGNLAKQLRRFVHLEEQTKKNNRTKAPPILNYIYFN